MRLKEAGLFLLGALIGALLLYYLLWRTDGLAPGHLLARTTADLAGRTEKVPPLPKIPFPTAPPPSPSPEASPSFSEDLSQTPVSLERPAAPTPGLEDFAELKGRDLAFPIKGYRLMELTDSFHEVRGGTRRHEAIDILAPRGTPIIGVTDGAVVKLFTSEQGGLTVYQFDEREQYSYYYAHLDRYAEGLKEGTILRKGEKVGYVGTSGNVPPDTPHLHFAIFRLGPEKRWWEGTAINPFPIFMGKSSARPLGVRPKSG